MSQHELLNTFSLMRFIFTSSLSPSFSAVTISLIIVAAEIEAFRFERFLPPKRDQFSFDLIFDGSRLCRCPSEQKKKFHRSGPISWKVLPTGRTLSVYNSSKGFIIKIHDNLGFKFRCTHLNVTGTTEGSGALLILKLSNQGSDKIISGRINLD